jgi:DEAD/DEAH box helicase domain-containing protein
MPPDTAGPRFPPGSLPPPRSWGVWDIETLRWAHEVPGGWRNAAAFGLAVAKVLDEQGRMHTFYEPNGPALIEFLAAKDLVVGFNSVGFDCAVLAAYGDVSAVRARSLDLLASLDAATGVAHCVSLERACHATLGAGKLLGDGGEAVRLWRAGTAEERRRVEAYCEHDVRLTYRLWAFGAANGHVVVPLRAAGRGAAVRLGAPTRVPVRWPAPVPRPAG